MRYSFSEHASGEASPAPTWEAGSPVLTPAKKQLLKTPMKLPFVDTPAGYRGTYGSEESEAALPRAESSSLGALSHLPDGGYRRDATSSVASSLGLNISGMTPEYGRQTRKSSGLSALLLNPIAFDLDVVADGSTVEAQGGGVEHAPVAYCRRWLVLTIVFLAGFAQTAMWNFYSPISRPCKAMFSWTDAQFAWLLNASNITFCVVGGAWPWVIDRVGLRCALTAAIAALAASALLRCVPYDVGSFAALSPASHYYWLLASMVLNGVAAPCLSLIPPVVSAAWFPLRERATATALLVASIYFGVTSGFAIGPNVVTALDGALAAHRNATRAELNEARRELSVLCYAEAAATVLLLLVALVGLRSKPPSAPTRSADASRTEFCGGLRDLLCRGCSRKLLRFAALTIALCAPVGVYAGFASVLDLYFADFGLDPKVSARARAPAGSRARDRIESNQLLRSSLHRTRRFFVSELPSCVHVITLASHRAVTLALPTALRVARRLVDARRVGRGGRDGRRRGSFRGADEMHCPCNVRRGGPLLSLVRAPRRAHPPSRGRRPRALANLRRIHWRRHVAERSDTDLF